jgi:hypothetical protein
LRQGRGPPASVILATRRPAFLPGAVRMARAQLHAPTELVVVLHGHAARSLEAPARAALAAADQVLEAPASWPLERCLDRGIAAAGGEIVAKLDDDDLYGPAYLGEAVAALEAGLGDVVGKTELYVHLAGQGQLLLWRPGASQAEQDYVLGGTLAFRRSLGIGFTPPPGEPGRMFGFLSRCATAGRRIYATSRRHYIHRRFPQPEHHTWQPPDLLFRHESVVVARDVGSDEAMLLGLVC